MKKNLMVALTAFATWYVTPIIDRAIPHCPGQMFMIGPQPYGMSVSCWGVHWFTPDEPSGFWSTQITLRPPSIHYSYLSNAWSEVLKDDRAWDYNNPDAVAWKKEREWIHDADEAKAWTFPNYPSNY